MSAETQVPTAAPAPVLTLTQEDSWLQPYEPVLLARQQRLAERLALTQYRAGSTSYLAVVTAQALALSNERAAVQLLGRQLAASVALITATGGGWSSAAPQSPCRRCGS